MAAVPKIQLAGVKKSFDANHVLKGINLNVAPQESLVIIGTSGGGKSVLMKCLNGLITPDTGSVKIDGLEILGQGRAALEDLRRRFGMTFQFGALFDSLPIWENVTFRLLQQQTLGKTAARDIAAKTITQLGLAESVIDQYPAELSGGMQKRVGLARAIATSPEIIFFDEPTTGLDPIMADVINDLIVESVKGLGATALSITHDMASARKIADKIAMIYEGEIIWCGDIKDLDNSGNPYVEQFIHGRAEGPISKHSDFAKSAKSKA